jgi:deoxyribose-phosphate aldolase
VIKKIQPYEILNSYYNIAKTIDHSLLQPDLTLKQIEEGCDIAIKYNANLVMSRPSDVKFIKKILDGTDIKIGCVVGFPHGHSTTKTKTFETLNAIDNGADEIDMVINIGFIKSKKYKDAERDIKKIVDVSENRIVKVILENSYLSYNEKVNSCKISESAGASYVKTSTGYAPTGATLEDVKIMISSVSEFVGVKAAGKVRTYDQVEEYIKHGVTRFGATATKSILDEFRSRNGLEKIV